MNSSVKIPPRASKPNCTIFISAIIALGLTCFVIYQNASLLQAVRSVTSLTTAHLATTISSPPPKADYYDRPIINRYMNRIKSLEDLSGQSDTAWSSMLNTPQGGFLWVKYNETNNMPWGVSMFHSIHCLSLLRRMLMMQLNNTTILETAQTNHTHQSEHSHAFDEGHVGHCFSYIAQVCEHNIMF